jgi:hypothetical protein
LAELRLAQLPGFSRSNVAIGEGLSYRAGSEIDASQVGDYRLTTPRGERREIPARAELWIDGVDEAGVYELSRGGAVLDRFAASFIDGRESDLSTSSSGRRTSDVPIDSPDVDFSWLEIALAGAALAFVALDFWALSRATRRWRSSEVAHAAI